MASEAAVRSGVQFAVRTGADVVFAHVYDPTVIGAPPATVGWSAEQQKHLLDEIRAQKERALSELAHSVPDTVSAKWVLLEDAAPARALAEYAGTHKIATIVISTHGRTGVRRFILGSVAEKVVRLAPCPVLTVPASREPASREPAGDDE